MARKKNKFTVKLDRDELYTLAHALKTYRTQLPLHLMDSPNLLSLQAKLNEQLPNMFGHADDKFKG